MLILAFVGVAVFAALLIARRTAETKHAAELMLEQYRDLLKEARRLRTEELRRRNSNE